MRDAETILIVDDEEVILENLTDLVRHSHYRVLQATNGLEALAILETSSFLKAARVSHLFARDSANIIKLEVIPAGDELMNGQITLVATSAELGDNVADVDASIEGEPLEIAFNAKYLIDVLSVIESPQVALETTAASSPGVIRPIGDDQFTHVIMPMHISR